MHHDPALWTDPDEFRPERFLHERPPAQQYLPFGGGPHQCLGRQFSLLEAVTAVVTILRQGKFELTSGQFGGRLRPAIALEPDPHPRAVFSLHRAGPGMAADHDGTAR